MKSRSLLSFHFCDPLGSLDSRVAPKSPLLWPCRPQWAPGRCLRRYANSSVGQEIHGDVPHLALLSSDGPPASYSNLQEKKKSFNKEIMRQIQGREQEKVKRASRWQFMSLLVRWRQRRRFDRESHILGHGVSDSKEVWVSSEYRFRVNMMVNPERQ